MNPNLAAFSASQISSSFLFEDTVGEQIAKDDEAVCSEWCDSSSKPARQSGRLHPRLAPYLAFFATVFACMAAAATVVNNDLPLMLGGF